MQRRVDLAFVFFVPWKKALLSECRRFHASITILLRTITARSRAQNLRLKVYKIYPLPWRVCIDPFVTNQAKKSSHPKMRTFISIWWSVGGSNSWPPACKTGALPAELTPHIIIQQMVGLNGLEPTTSPLSGVRSNHLSYKPVEVLLLIFIRQSVWALQSTLL